MYDGVMAKRSRQPSAGIVPGILRELLERRGMTATQLADRIGVNKSTISLILSGKRPNTTAANMAKMADELNVSVDYLIGKSDVAEPTSLMLGEILVELTQVARHLPPSKQRDLLAIARTYAEQMKEAQQDDVRLMNYVLDLIEELEGEVSRDQLIDLLKATRRHRVEDSDESLLLTGDKDEPPQGNE